MNKIEYLLNPSWKLIKKLDIDLKPMTINLTSKKICLELWKLTMIHVKDLETRYGPLIYEIWLENYIEFIKIETFS